jgi:predicted nucleotidyltransferase
MVISLREKAVLVAKEIRAELRPTRILLFGSAARGTETESSDIDLCLLFEAMPGRKLEVLRKARRLARPVFKGGMDFVAYSVEEWGAYLAAESSFETALDREAVAL